ncbi:hypothetical protein AVEN_57203-1 [Araneus ventricosus]|uniref:Uncharacterized protein n=1 Tax=Araneus ventricosus TaxID=182803 RepID=A0A4Y2MU98_ARAVE|nr:hypothetical protein AVEN_57203-1 [Araneus ventricosus]
MKAHRLSASCVLQALSEVLEQTERVGVVHTAARHQSRIHIFPTGFKSGKKAGHPKEVILSFAMPSSTIVARLTDTVSKTHPTGIAVSALLTCYLNRLTVLHEIVVLVDADRSAEALSPCILAVPTK